MENLVENRPRNKRGRFVRFSKLGDKYVSTKLYKEDQEKLFKLAEEQGVSPAELNRQIVHEWLKTA